MDNTTQYQNWISRMSLAAANTALAFAAVLMLAVITIRSAQAQTFTTLTSFDVTNGSFPLAPLVQATNGNLYGTTEFGGSTDGGKINPFGTVFKITPSGTLTTLDSLAVQDASAPEPEPTAGLVQATNGDLYGTTTGGGANGLGAVFKITPTGRSPRPAN